MRLPQAGARACCSTRRDALDLDLSRSWMIGDTDADVAAGRAAGCRTVLIEHAGQRPQALGTADRRRRRCPTCSAERPAYRFWERAE